MPFDQQTLLSCESGIPLRVVRFEGGTQFRRRLESMGLSEGKLISKVHQQPFRGPVTVRIKHTQLAIGHSMAGRIVVVPLP